MLLRLPYQQIARKAQPPGDVIHRLNIIASTVPAREPLTTRPDPTGSNTGPI
jgi:hypothetical protein